MWFDHIWAFETYSANMVVYHCDVLWLFTTSDCDVLWLFLDGRRGLAVAAQTPSGSWASAGAEEWHHQSGLWQRVRRRWISETSPVPTETDVFISAAQPTSAQPVKLTGNMTSSVPTSLSHKGFQMIQGFSWGEVDVGWLHWFLMWSTELR